MKDKDWQLLLTIGCYLSTSSVNLESDGESFG